MLNIIKSETVRKKAKVFSLLCIVTLSLGLSSCKDSFLYEEDEDCHPGINLRFVYDYHMEPKANAFPSNVDCVNVFVFDTDGNFIKQFAETSNVLEDENYRMSIPLDEGSYHLVVYGGVGCDHPTFDFVPQWPVTSRATGTQDDILVTLPANPNGESKLKLHDIEERWGGLFWGTLDVTVDEHDWRSPKDMRVETVYMMKDTNNIQIILQELSYPRHVNYAEYDFKIIDDNFVLDGYNNVIETATESYQPFYTPYAGENKLMGYAEPGVNSGDPASIDPDETVQVACVEFSTSRLLYDHIGTARLLVTSNKEFDKEGNPLVIIDIPLIRYLIATRGFGQNWIKADAEFNHNLPGFDNLDQQYLDRQSNWTLYFFLMKNVWVSARVVVNEWTVRVNDIQL